MSEQIPRDVYELLDEADCLDRGSAQAALLEEAVRLAEACRDEFLSYLARDRLIEAATFGGEMDKALVAFTWCLAIADRHPEEYPYQELLWKYKWVGQMMSEFPQFSKQQIGDALDDMTRRYQQAGSTLQAVYLLRYQVALNMGDEPNVRRFFRQWNETPQDPWSNGRSYELSKTVEYHRFVREDRLACEMAEPIIHGQMQATETDPHSTLAHLLLPLVRLGRWEEAAANHRRGLPMVRKNPFFLTEISEHLTFLALTDNLAGAVKLLEKHLPWTQSPCTPFLCFYFQLAALFLTVNECANLSC